MTNSFHEISDEETLGICCPEVLKAIPRHLRDRISFKLQVKGTDTSIEYIPGAARKGVILDGVLEGE